MPKGRKFLVLGAAGRDFPRSQLASTRFNDWVSDREIAYMEARAHGGEGMATTQGAYTDPRGEGKGYVGMMAIHDDRFIPGLKKITGVIRAHGARSVCQLMHCGRVGGVELSYNVGPSQVSQRIPRFREPIEQEIENHAQGARRIAEAGFDMVEISGIVEYLISNFISSYTNKRTDEYGGDVKGRAKFMTDDIMRACRNSLEDQQEGIIPGMVCNTCLVRLKTPLPDDQNLHDLELGEHIPDWSGHDTEAAIPINEWVIPPCGMNIPARGIDALYVS